MYRIRILHYGCLVFLLAFFFINTAQAKPIKISLLLRDSLTRNAIFAIKSLNLGTTEVEIKVYSLNTLKKSDLEFLKNSHLIILDVMDRQRVNEIKAELNMAISKNAKVFAVASSGSYNEEMKDMGISVDKKIEDYYQSGGVENFKNMLLYTLKEYFGLSLEVSEPIKSPNFALYDYKGKRIFATFEEFIKVKGETYLKRPLIGLVFYKNSYEGGQLKHIDALIEALEKEGFGVLPAYGWPSEEVVERYFFDSEGKARVRLVIGLALKVGLNSKRAIMVFNKLGVPIINAITLYSQSKEEFENSPLGLSIYERTWQVGLPELGGIIQPIVIASKEKRIDPDTKMEYIEENPIQERIERLVERIKAWINLQNKPNRDKRIALIYYNYPPGKQNIGAAYLNVLPESLWTILNRLKDEGYYIGEKELSKDRLFEEIQNYGRNIGNWAQAEIDNLARSGKAVLIPLKTYKEWFEELPEGFKKAVLKDWGAPEDNKIMTWIGRSGTKYIVIPVVQYGNILLTPQPSRGWEQDIKKLYHDVTLPPHHQYIAFYLWLKKGFKADAIVHIGTHGTHEWLSGKEVGFTKEDPPDLLLQDLPNIYPYIVDDVGEGLQAKRRGLAVIIDHMTPPVAKTYLQSELKEIQSLIQDYQIAKQKSPLLAEAKLREIIRLVEKLGLHTDLGFKELSEETLEELEHYLKTMEEKMVPFGLHTFGKAPSKDLIRSTAEAILSLEKGLTEEEREKKLKELEKKIEYSATRELDSLIRALEGKYIPAGPGNDPIRNPDALPTGKNFYSFDPSKIPSPSIFELGAKLAQDLIEDYKRRHGFYPDKLTFILWAVETIRHEGIMESQILYLLGIKPKWDERGRVIGIEVIPRQKLARPRVDITIIPSGLYRDLFPNLMDLLDKAVSLAKEQKEDDNFLRSHVLKLKERLIAKGLSEEMAEKLATVRIFTEPPGAYGTNLDKVISNSHTWDRESEVVEVYFNRLGYLYGQGFWGDKLKENLNQLLFKSALSGTKIAVHSRSSQIFATLDNDDFFQYLGGTAMAIRILDGKTPELFITDISNPKEPKQETLNRFMGRELRTR
ncbi:MAG: cobaltochelatase subunit CobN, partial [Caldimicrobium sp.]